jgi:hypothetical protein
VVTASVGERRVNSLGLFGERCLPLVFLASSLRLHVRGDGGSLTISVESGVVGCPTLSAWVCLGGSLWLVVHRRQVGSGANERRRSPPPSPSPSRGEGSAWLARVESVVGVDPRQVGDGGANDARRCPPPSPSPSRGEGSSRLSWVGVCGWPLIRVRLGTAAQTMRVGAPPPSPSPSRGEGSAWRSRVESVVGL